MFALFKERNMIDDRLSHARLHKMGLLSSPDYTSNSAVGTALCMFRECDKVKNLWTRV